MAALRRPLPSFVHKWSGVIRPYSRAELALPKNVQVWGRAPDDHEIYVAVGGTRSPSVETFCLVTRVCRSLAEQGCAIVSGGVPGVDLAAHSGALDIARGRTYAVMANPAHMGLAGHEWKSDVLDRAIRDSGAFISEYSTIVEVGGLEIGERLLQRDRIISGLCDVFVAFECNINSATVDTAMRALAQGKKVIAVTPRMQTARRGAQMLGNDPRILGLLERDLSAEEIASAIRNCAMCTPGS